ncbi:maleylpyruvate isomerase family mycothiol-dependent enzyme [Actinomycetospora termitidis]|uniref:Maleylpyruvate isomerase family mycothiol-dependent enzyme n=1 Tax=Actinomycetospora termitidis TaxID=3053470 RepID=A0ABT7M9N7_9PSEU|nr:maleylpyruvate isomerase family mycothiol-dependent enzyme [Actinomycetospora sp. Odt1-22]MDL5157388.1 maleylpyruvate isomerase family mycothiol-dependent enzyme [Actinomycetospora sp. Odt1-22]
MTRVEMLEDVAAERLDLADELEDLTDDEWATPSLCAGWTVRDVVAHLTMSTRTSVPRVARAVLRARGDVDRAFADEARERARSFTPAQLIAQLREMAHVDRRLRISGPLDPLNDLLVHRQDIAVPLGHPTDVPAARVEPCLDHTWAAPFVGAARRFAGLRLVATDCAWTRGDGPELRGPASGMLLALNGRVAGLDRLDGPGLEEARTRY